MNFEDKTILVTGGAGFIGSNIVEELLKTNIKCVRVIDNLSTGFIKNLESFMSDKRLEFVYGDISRIEVCRNIVKGVDMVCHQAALGSVPRSVDDPLTSHLMNVDGTLNLLVSCRDEGIKRFVFASSSAVYGDEENLPKREDRVGKPLSPYGITKKIKELYAQNFTELYGMECIGLRYFNVFGRRQNPKGVYSAVIPKFIFNALHNEDIVINGDGTYSRDFTYIDNVVQANLLALTTENTNLYGGVLNIGNGGRIYINELVDNIIDYVPTFSGEIIHGPNRVGDIPHSNADITKAQEELGYRVNVTFDEGILETVRYYRNESKK